MNLDPVLLEIMVCPDCHSSLTPRPEASELSCDGCGLAYPVLDDAIPVLLVDEARRPGQPDAEPSDAAVARSGDPPAAQDSQAP